jgi:hypothetical protein
MYNLLFLSILLDKNLQYCYIYSHEPKKPVEALGNVTMDVT